MEKDNKAKYCDRCGRTASGTRDGLVLCKRHLLASTKEASDDMTLKTAPIHLADQHKQK